MRILIPVFFILTLSYCGSDSGGSDNDASIYGSWTFTSEDPVCQEVITFNENETFRGTSNQELVTGSYSIEKPEGSSKKQVLEIAIISDNEQPDCLESTEDDAGTVYEWIVKYDEDSLKFYVDESDTTAAIIYTR